MTSTLNGASIPAVDRIRRMVAGYDGPQDIAGQLQLAEHLSRARKAVPLMYQDSPGDVLAAIYTATALDIPVTSAIHHLFYGDNGRAGMSAALMQALILRAGHTVMIEVDDMRASGILTRGDGRPDGLATWTIAEAAAARLTLNETWRMYPSDCLYARCLARLARRYAADVVLGFGYVPEELTNGAVDDPVSEAPARPVDPEVVALLADLTTLDYRQTVALMDKARKAGLDKAYAGDVGGSPVTVMEVLVNHATLSRPAAVAPAPPAPPADVPAADAPAGEGTLDCGCPAAVVAETGAHVAGKCTRLQPQAA